MDINNSTNAHVLKMLKLNEQQEKLGLTKKNKFFPKNINKFKFNKETLRHKIQDLNNNYNNNREQNMGNFHNFNENKHNFFDKFNKHINNNFNNINEYITDSDKITETKNFLSSPFCNNINNFFMDKSN